MLQFPIFTDPIYHADKLVEFHPHEIVRVHEVDKRLFLRGLRPVTLVKLRDGRELVLDGHVKAQIEEQVNALAWR